MVFDAVIASNLVERLPSSKFAANDGPFVAELIVKLNHPLLVLVAPLLAGVGGINMR
jgi:hypothetical protein